MNWSPYQRAIFDFNINGLQNLFVDAKAGSGKSTVIKHCVNEAPETESVLAVAFGNDIARNLQSYFELSPNVEAMTTHVFGKAAHIEQVGYVKIREHKVRNLLRYQILPDKPELLRKVQYAVIRLVGLLKSNLTWEITPERIDSLMCEFGIDVDSEISTEQLTDIIAATWKENFRRTKTIDFDDMIAMPLYHNAKIPQFDRVYVDEAQDFTHSQIELCFKATGGRSTWVGDPRQAIYQFRGADRDAVPRIIETAKCHQLPLSVCYRCAKAVVEVAQRIVPDIEAFEDNIDGEVNMSLPYDDYRNQLQSGDFVLCRTTAPLVSECIQSILENRRAFVKGKEIGVGLEALLDRVYTAGNGSMAQQLVEYKDGVITRFEGTQREKRIDQVEMDVDALLAIIERTQDPTPTEVKRAISDLFAQDKKDAITYSTIHRVKGLETDRVHLIKPEQIPHKRAKSEKDLEAERNLEYVGITRAKQVLNYVVEDNDR